MEDLKHGGARLMKAFMVLVYLVEPQPPLSGTSVHRIEDLAGFLIGMLYLHVVNNRDWKPFPRDQYREIFLQVGS